MAAPTCIRVRACRNRLIWFWRGPFLHVAQVDLAVLPQVQRAREERQDDGRPAARLREPKDPWGRRGEREDMERPRAPRWVRHRGESRDDADNLGDRL